MCISRSDFHNLYRCNGGSWEKAIDAAFNVDERVTYWKASNGDTYSWGAWGNAGTCTKPVSEWQPYARVRYCLGCIQYNGETLDNGATGGFRQWLWDHNGWIGTYDQVVEAVKKNPQLAPYAYSLVASPPNPYTPGTVPKHEGADTYAAYNFKSFPIENDGDSWSNWPSFTGSSQRNAFAWVWLPEKLAESLKKADPKTSYTWINNEYSTAVFVNAIN